MTWKRSKYSMPSPLQFLFLGSQAPYIHRKDCMEDSLLVEEDQVTEHLNKPDKSKNKTKTNPSLWVIVARAHEC